MGVQVLRHLRSSLHKTAWPLSSQGLRAAVGRLARFATTRIKAFSLLAVYVLALCLLTPVSAKAFWSKYRVYQCGSSYEAYKCQTCQQLPALRLGFEVDVGRQMVALTVFEYGRAGANQILLDCSVNSKESWGCGEKSTRKSGRLVASTSYSMTNGLFTAENASFSGQSSQTGFYCGKP